jgi:hypothetical protein
LATAAPFKLLTNVFKNVLKVLPIIFRMHRNKIYQPVEKFIKEKTV